ncbi:MAG TPA: Dabb family protein [Candidatus Hydrogenedentes bacterium]|nr:Dabb family protein [Candidatus Hydrogenedentota bacterium]HNT89097.1 Dabb family protein [Candidatus Hydrogenedentota bacterium]
MLVHSVYFWLKEDIDATEYEAFRAGLESLRDIPGVVDLYVGVPAATPPRPVVDASYTFGLVVVLEELDAHDRYQAHPLHKAFLKQFSNYWAKVLVYDVI